MNALMCQDKCLATAGTVWWETIFEEENTSTKIFVVWERSMVQQPAQSLIFSANLYFYPQNKSYTKNKFLVCACVTAGPGDAGDGESGEGGSECDVGV